MARSDTTYLVTNMMRSVLNEGTGAGARAAGFSIDAAAKSGTTNDLRDAWFVGFTRELLTVVWVGFDDNQPLGLTGSTAALPIWTDFMKAAHAGRSNESFEVPEGISFVDIDHDTGKLATPDCPKVFTESFLVGTEPVEYCELHRASQPFPFPQPPSPSSPAPFPLPPSSPCPLLPPAPCPLPPPSLNFRQVGFVDISGCFDTGIGDLRPSPTSSTGPTITGTTARGGEPRQSLDHGDTTRPIAVDTAFCRC